MTGWGWDAMTYMDAQDGHGWGWVCAGGDGGLDSRLRGNDGWGAGVTGWG